jgi:hypothetical protein
MRRQPDGSWRGNKQPVVVTGSGLRARWVEAETIHLKCMGLSFDAIAAQITRVGRGEAQAMTAVPDGATFPRDFRITRQACHRAFRRAIARQPALEAAELRKLDFARTEEMYLRLLPGIRKGDPRSIGVGVKVLSHSAQVHGYGAPNRHDVAGKDGKPLTIVHLLELLGTIPDGPSRAALEYAKSTRACEMMPAPAVEVAAESEPAPAASNEEEVNLEGLKWKS